MCTAGAVEDESDAGILGDQESLYELIRNAGVECVAIV